jgi:hypothetical protein
VKPFLYNTHKHVGKSEEHFLAPEGRNLCKSKNREFYRDIGREERVPVDISVEMLPVPGTNKLKVRV